VVEVDAKEIRLSHGVVLQRFSARGVVSRWDVVGVHRRATSLAAARFLDTLLERALRSHNEEFYELMADSGQLPARNRQPLGWEHTHNCARPHQAPGYLIPSEFVAQWKRSVQNQECH
jgi:hypothetical protein